MGWGPAGMPAQAARLLGHGGVRVVARVAGVWAMVSARHRTGPVPVRSGDGTGRVAGRPGQRLISLIFSMRVMTLSSSASSKTFFQSSRTMDSRP